MLELRSFSNVSIFSNYPSPSSSLFAFLPLHPFQHLPLLALSPSLWSFPLIPPSPTLSILSKSLSFPAIGSSFQVPFLLPDIPPLPNNPSLFHLSIPSPIIPHEGERRERCNENNTLRWGWGVDDGLGSAKGPEGGKEGRWARNEGRPGKEGRVGKS